MFNVLSMVNDICQKSKQKECYLETYMASSFFN